MTCDKCDDIHTAQKEGKTQDECSCSCHKDSNPLVNPDTNPITVWPYFIPCFQPCTPCCTPCCPCTDPCNVGKAMWLVCNCPCHCQTYLPDHTGTAPPFGSNTFYYTTSNTQGSERTGRYY